MARKNNSTDPYRQAGPVGIALLIFVWTFTSWRIYAKPIPACINPCGSDSSGITTSQEDAGHGVDARALVQGNQIDRELSGDEVHTYEIAIAAGQYVHFVLVQQGIDVVIKAFTPGMELVNEVDRPISSLGREAISIVAEVSGTYTLRIQSLERTAGRGHYTVELSEIRVAAPRDDSRVAAEKAVTEGERLRAKKTAESFRLSIDKFESAAALWRALDDPYEEAIALYGSGLAHRSIGENQKAADCFGKALPIMVRLGDLCGQAITLTGLAWTHLYLGDYARALDNFSGALVVRRSISDKRGEALTLHGLAWANALSRNLQAALRDFQEALSIRRSLNDRQGEALTLIGISQVSSRLGDRRSALDGLARAVNLLREVGDQYGEAEALSSRGWVLVSAGDCRLALADFNEALPLRRLTGDRTGEATTLSGIAEAERQQGNLMNARASMEAALNIIENLGPTGSSQELRMTYLTSIHSYYDRYIDLLQSLHRLYPDKGYAAAALQASERAKARNLLDLLAEIKVDIHQDVDPGLLEKQRALQQQLNVAADRQQRLRNRPREEVQAAAAQVESLTTLYRENQTEIRTASPRFAALTRPDPLTLTQIQQQVLDEGTMLLEYSLGEERSYLWAVTPTTLESFQLPKRDEIEAAARLVFGLMTARSSTRPGESTGDLRARVARADAEYPVAAAALSRMLLGPVAARLETKRLLLVLEGELQFIPFGALPTPLSREIRRDPRPLVLDHEIATMPSASTLAVLRRETSGRVPAPRKITVIADPVFSPYDERIRVKDRNEDDARGAAGRSRTVAGGFDDWNAGGETDDGSTNQRLPRLFATRWEAEQIVALVPPGEALLALDFAANRELMFGGPLEEYQILHFATHALIDNQHPELSGIALSMVDERGRERNGFLRAHDIFNLKIHADLVVLSGCRTATGKNVRGEGLVGLSRGFMHAGTPRVVASLWSLSDRAAAEVMVRFYRKMLGPGRTPTLEALRLAQIEMLRHKRWQAPYFWSGFILQGDWL